VGIVDTVPSGMNDASLSKCITKIAMYSIPLVEP
jgi:hypothetical protein